MKTQAKFTADEYDNCKYHGQYVSSGFINGKRYSVPMCLECQKKLHQLKLVSDTKVPRNTANCTFNNYVIGDGNDKQSQIFKTCYEYAQGFNPDITVSPSIIMLGKVGTGKNHLSTAIVKTVSQKGFSALHMQGIDYLDLYWGKSFSDRPRWVKELANIDLLILDEVEKTPRTKGSDDGYFRLIQARAMNLKPSIIISNYSYEKLPSVITEAGVDRLRDYDGIGLNFNWQSYRGKRK